MKTLTLTALTCTAVMALLSLLSHYASDRLSQETQVPAKSEVTTPVVQTD